MSGIYQEAVKAILTALATILATQAANLFEILTDPDSPAKIFEEGKKTIDLVHAWGEACEQLQRTPATPLRDDAQARIDKILRELNERQIRYTQARDMRRSRLLNLLGYFRLHGLKGWTKRVSSVLFYIAIVMLIQTISLVLSGRQDIAPSLIAWFAAIAILFWLLSWPTKAPLKNRSTIAPEEQGDRVKAAGATGLQ